MHPTLLSLAIIAYVAATGLSLAYLVQREEWIHRLASLATIGGWLLHTGALLARGLELGRPPLASLPLRLQAAGPPYLRVPALGTLGRRPYRPPAPGVPFPPTGILPGGRLAGPAWGSVLTVDPLALLSVVAWTIYAGTLAGRTAAG